MDPEKHVAMKVKQNLDNFNQLRTFSSLIAGIAAGILGITGYFGFIFFALHALLASVIFQSVNCKGAPQRYIPGASLFNMGSLTKGALTYILAWTIVYDTVYIF